MADSKDKFFFRRVDFKDITFKTTQHLGLIPGNIIILEGFRQDVLIELVSNGLFHGLMSEITRAGQLWCIGGRSPAAGGDCTDGDKSKNRCILEEMNQPGPEETPGFDHALA